MGHGDYSAAAHAALIADRSSKPVTEVFRQRGCHMLMNPQGLKVRESRDNADHPNSLGIVFALDVTGSMGGIPRQLAREELPTFMTLLTACGITDPQLMFMAIGDATSDGAPLQVGQFESTAELMDQWLTWSYLEGGGGGTNSESYELAFYVLAQHTDLDCWQKRKKKGYLFMTGDELPYPAVSRHQIEALIGDKLDEDIPIEEVIAAAAESYHLFFLIPDLARRSRCEARWRALLGDHVICMESPSDACAVAAAIVALTEGQIGSESAKSGQAGESGKPDIGKLAGTLKANGVPAERVSAVVRALKSYVALLEPNGGSGVPPHSSSPPAPSSASSWWRRLFG